MLLVVLAPRALGNVSSVQNLYLGAAKAKTELEKVGRQLGEDQMDSDRRSSFAKVAD